MTADDAGDLARLLSRYTTEPNTGCWLWTGAVYSTGYGAFSRGGRHWKAHRASYHLHVGPVPDGLWVCHRCDQRSCINPAHLYVGTATDNNRDTVRRRRRRWPTHLQPHGEAHSSSKLTDAQRLVICALIDAGETTKHAIAKSFGVSPQLIAPILRWRARCAERASHSS